MSKTLRSWLGFILVLISVSSGCYAFYVGNPVPWLIIYAVGGTIGILMGVKELRRVI